MKRMLLIVCLAAISLLAGVAIAGRPSSVPDDLVIASPSSPSSSLTSSPPTTTDLGTNGTTATSTAPSVTATVTPSSTTAPITNPSTAAPSTSVPSTPPPTTSLVPMDQTRVVVANATSSPGLARTHADQLEPLGYTTTATDSTLPIENTTVYFAEGFQSEAARLAEQADVPLDAVQPRLDDGMTVDDDDGDLWLIIAPDRAP